MSLRRPMQGPGALVGVGAIGYPAEFLASLDKFLLDGPGRIEQR